MIEVNKLKADKEELLKSLHGVYKEQFILILGNLLKGYDFFKEQMKNYESLIESVLQKMLPQDQYGNSPQLKLKHHM